MNAERVLLILVLMSMTSSLRGQVITDSVFIEGRYRSFHYHKPGKPERGAALVFVMHGSGGDGLGIMKAAKKMDSKARAEHAIVVYPNGYKKYWNECRMASPADANRLNINEEAFFQSMIGYFAKRFRINRKKVFAVGTSGGGHMAYKLAVTMPDKIRAVTAIIANLPDSSNFDCIASGKAVPVMIVNGTEDKVNPYHGGEVFSGFSLGNVRSTDKTFRYWADLAGHTGDPKKETLPDNDPTDGKIIEKYSYESNGKPDVILLKVIGGKHDYPGDIDVHTEAWKFFTSQLQKD